MELFETLVKITTLQLEHDGFGSSVTLQSFQMPSTVAAILLHIHLDVNPIWPVLRTGPCANQRSNRGLHLA